jgi:hypothetical protein
MPQQSDTSPKEADVPYRRPSSPSLNKASTAGAMIDCFKDEMVRFGDATIRFKSGILEFGVLGLGHVQNMYYYLPAARHITDYPEESELFINDIDSLRREMVIYSKRKKPTDGNTYLMFSDYDEIDNRYDAVVRAFFMILYKTGFSP